MERLLQDLTYGARLLVRNKAFTITAVTTLAVCIAANVAIFCIVNSVVLRPLPFPESDHLVYLYNSYSKAGIERASTGVPDYFDRMRKVPALGRQAIFRNDGLTIGAAGDAERVTALRATPSLFVLLGVRPLRGRTFTEDEGEIGHEHKAVLSYALWQRRFGGRDDAVGRDLRVNGQPYAIVGVLPRDFHFISDSDEPLLYVPAAFTPAEKSDDARHSNNWEMFGRLKPGATIDEVRRQVNTLNARNLDRFPQFKEIIVNAGFHTSVVWLQADLVRDVKPTLYLLWAGAAFVLLIGGVNVANLMLVRATARLKELATRHVLGASLGRLARQLLTETTLLTLTGGAFGLLLGYWTLQAISRLGIEHLPRASDIHLDAAVFAFTLAISLATGLLVGIVPLLGMRKSTLNQAFREEGRSTTGGRRARIMRTVLVTTQVAVALMLLVGAGLLFASFRRLLAVDPGFSPANVVTAQVTLPETAYPDAAARRVFAARALDGVRAVPGVASAGVADSVPFSNSFDSSVIVAEGYVMRPGESLVAPFQFASSEGYFEAMRMRLLRGRLFDRRDSDTSTPVVIVDERLARRFWPGADPIGKRLFTPNSPTDMLKPNPNTRYLSVVGVVREVKYLGLAPIAAMEPTGACYFPTTQRPTRSLYLVINTHADSSAVVPAVRKAIGAIDPELPLYDVKTMQERIDASLGDRRTPMLLALAFAGVALLLAAVGVYGVLAYQVTQRTREIGIRMALGGGTVSIFRLVFRDAVTMVGGGIVAGLAGAFVMSRSLQSHLFGVGSMDPEVIAVVAALLAIVALAASVVPAMRATRVEPIRALTDL
jgi:predicted permease